MHPKIRVWELPPADPAQVTSGLKRLALAAGGNQDQAVEALRRCVPEYAPHSPDESPAALRRAGAVPRYAAA
jgi:hypothetical protein